MRLTRLRLPGEGGRVRFWKQMPNDQNRAKWCLLNDAKTREKFLKHQPCMSPAPTSSPPTMVFKIQSRDGALLICVCVCVCGTLFYLVKSTGRRLYDDG